MTAPKLALHAALSGLYGGLIVALVLGLVNPAPLPAGSLSTRFVVAVVGFYAAAAGVVWPLLYGALRFFASHPLRVPWLSLRYLMAFHVVNTGAVLASGWATLSRYRRVTDPVDVDRLTHVCLGLSLAWLGAALVSLLPSLRRVRSLQIGSAGLALVALALALPGGRSRPAPLPGATGPRPPLTPPVARLILLNFDGADLDTVLTLQAQGNLPAFSHLRETGAFGRLRSIVPCHAAVTRTALVTGRLPHRDGVRTGEARRILGGGAWLQAVPAGLGFDMFLAPLLETRGVTIADRTGLALWEVAALAGGAGDAAGFEVDLDRRNSRAGMDPAAVKWEIPAELLDPEVIRKADPSSRGPLGDLAAALEADAQISAAVERLVRDRRPGVLALSFPGLDRVAHRFLRYARPEEFGDVTRSEIDLFGEVLERYYRRVDAIVGKAIEAAGAADYLIVTSSHGMEPVSLRRRLLALAMGAERRSGTHAGGPDGLLFVRGPGVRRGPLPAKGGIVDVVPTALYALGLPLASDLDGTILTAVFSARFTLEHPVSVIGSYEAPARDDREPAP